MKLRYTKYISISPTSKQFSYNKSTKKIEKVSIGEMYDAQAIIIDSDLKSFGESLADMESNESCSFGLPLAKFKQEITQVTTNKRRAQYPNAMVRDAKDMTFRKGVPGIFFIDYDPSPYGGKTLTPQQFLKILFEVDPQLALCEYVLRGSVSAGVHVKGSKPGVSKSFHVYFSITDMSAIPDYGKLIYNRLWLLGYGFMALSSVGGMMERTLVDACVWQPNRLDFTGQPVIVSDELVYAPPKMIFVEGVAIDPKLLPKLTAKELNEVLEKKQDERVIRQPEVPAKKEAYIKNKLPAIMAKGFSVDDAILILRDRVDRTVYELYAHDFLQFKNPELKDVTVGEVFMDWQRFEGEALVDPDEDRASYPDDSARFYWNKGKNPIVVSWGHGGRNFKLFNKAKKLGAGNGGNTINDNDRILGNADDEFEDEPVASFGAGSGKKNSKSNAGNRNDANGGNNGPGGDDAGGDGGQSDSGNGNHGNGGMGHAGGGGDWREELKLVTKILAEMEGDTSAWSKSANMDGFLRALLVLECDAFEEYQKVLKELTRLKVKSEVNKKLKELRAADRAEEKAANKAAMSAAIDDRSYGDDCDLTQPLDKSGFPDYSITPATQNKPATIVLKATKENLAHLLDGYGITCSYNEISKEQGINFPDGFGHSSDLSDSAKLQDIISLLIKNDIHPRAVDSLVSLMDGNCFNPLLDWIDSVPWDGKSRLKKLFESVTVEKSMIGFRDDLMRTWLIQCVAGWDGGEQSPISYKIPKYELVLTFQGLQGLKKTSWFRSLFDVEHVDYFRGGLHLDPTVKDKIFEAVSCGIGEWGELDSTLKKDIAMIKAFLSLSTDLLRLPYGRTWSKFKRRTSFCASVNETRFLRDPTGSRRFGVIPILNTNYFHRINMQQVWAEVWELYINGAEWWMSEELEAKNRENAAQFTELCLVEENFNQVFHAERKPGKETEATSSEMIEWHNAKSVMEACLNTKNHTKQNLNICSSILSSGGYKEKRISTTSKKYLLSMKLPYSAPKT